MLRVGPYLVHDISLGTTDRQTTEGGVRAKLTPPILPRPWRTWAFLGLGYARSYRPSHLLEPATGEPGGEVGGAEGDFLDADLGIGIGMRARGAWGVFAELGVRTGFLFWGAMYDRTSCSCAQDPYPGHDSFAASLSVGVSLDL